jgi:hypothetical protein
MRQFPRQLPNNFFLLFASNATKLRVRKRNGARTGQRQICVAVRQGVVRLDRHLIALHLHPVKATPIADLSIGCVPQILPISSNSFLCVGEPIGRAIVLPVRPRTTTPECRFSTTTETYSDNIRSLRDI